MFDPNNKSPISVVEHQAKTILGSPLFARLLASSPNVLMILNLHRQVVYLNRNPVPASESLAGSPLGQRPGECLACINIAKGELGCGSSEFCKVCGFNAAISASEKGQPGSDECHIALKSGASLTLEVSTLPFTHEGETFIFCALEDISEKKRRQMLESIFLHDILNTAAILRGLGEAYDDMSDRQKKAMLKDISANIGDEVQSYRLISNMETQTITPNYTLVDTGELTHDVVDSLQNMQRFKDKRVSMHVENATITTERTLLRRVLINMIKNAFEAGKKDDTIRIETQYNGDSDQVRIVVQNPQVIPRATQLKLFQKSFSTKGRGRGWGTYSIKILTEKYLKGEVTFRSNQKSGTEFSISIPSLR